jgi:hypothetical protein
MRLKKLRGAGVAVWATALDTVNSNMTRAHFICACFSKRCKTCQTLYQSPMTRALAIGLLLILAAPLASAKSKKCTVRLHVQGNENDGSVFTTPVTTPISGKNIFIEKIPTISEHDVSAYRPYAAANGTFGALLELDEHGKLALDTLSVERRGSTALVFIDGRIVTEFLIDRRVSDGQIFIASGLTAADIASMEKTWPKIGAKKRK